MAKEANKILEIMIIVSENKNDFNIDLTLKFDKEITKKMRAVIYSDMTNIMERDVGDVIAPIL